MFGTTQYGVAAYTQIGIESSVAVASPHQLVTMLLEGALTAIEKSEQYMQVGHFEKKGDFIGKAISIIEDGFRATLDKEAGGEMAQDLDSLYEYMSCRLLKAHLKNKPEILHEVRDLLKQLKEAWETIGANAQQ